LNNFHDKKLMYLLSDEGQITLVLAVWIVMYYIR